MMVKILRNFPPNLIRDYSENYHCLRTINAIRILKSKKGR